METERLKSIVAWIKTTDLAELSFKDGGEGFAFSTAQKAAAAPYYFPGPRLTAVVSQSVGLFHWNQLGKSQPFQEGDKVSAGDVLGLIDGGLKKTVPVAAPCAGLLHKISIEAGAPVQFGQPLFFIEPRDERP